MEPLLQAFDVLRCTSGVARDKAAALFEPRVFDAWNQLVHALLWQRIQGAGNDAVLPLVQELYQNGPAETAAMRAFALAGISRPSVSSQTGLRALAMAGVWNEQRAAAVVHLLLLSPEYWQRNLSSFPAAD
jgi:hypothetical protein